MKFQLEIADRVRAVEVRRITGGFEVTVDGRKTLVDAVRLASGTWSLIVSGPAREAAQSLEAVVGPQNGHGTVDVHIDGYRIPVHLRTGLGRRTRGTGGSRGAGLQRVVAPMPGKVVRVLVRVGDQVRPQQGLVVVEAMKMENELRAARQGCVREVFVGEGQSVDAGTPLLIVE